MEREIVLKIRNVSKTYPGVKALQNVNFDVLKGEAHALVGANGAGKSTLIKILGGIVYPDKGASIEIAGEPVKLQNAKESAAHGISIIYQDLSLFPNLTVFENIMIETVSENSGIIMWNKMRDCAKNALQTLNVDINLNELVGKLSMAKQQLVAIARSLAHNSKIIIMDEPTSALSKDEIKELLAIICKLKKQGLSIMFVSHKLDELLTVCDNFSILKDGKYLDTFTREEVDKEILIREMVGEDVKIHREIRQLSDVEVLRVEHLSKRGNFKDISFNLRKGEILGITGIVGAGRSELAEAIFGLNPADGGHIYIDGMEVKIHSAADAIEHGIAYLPENRQMHGLLLKKTVMDNIAVVTIKRMVNRFGYLDINKKRIVAKEWIEKLKITPPFEDMEAQQLSGGNQQRIVLAKWLSSAPKILIVDEPTNGIDVAAKKEICEIIRSMAKKGISVIIISSELEEIFDYSDRIIVMRKGMISSILNTEDASHELIMSRACLETQIHATTSA